MSILVFVRPAPAWDKLRFDLSTGAVEVPADTLVGLSAFGEGTWTLNVSDRAALDAAVGLGVEGQGSEVRNGANGGAEAVPPQIIAVALASHPADAAEAALREALARGATQAILVTGAPAADAYLTTSVLATLVDHLAIRGGVDTVLLGAETPGDWPDEVGPMLAEALGWASLSAARALQATADGSGLHATTAVGTFALPRPAVVSLLPNPALSPRYAPGGAVIAAFRKQTVEPLSLADLGLTGAGDDLATARVTVRRATLGAPPVSERLNGPVEESVAVLLAGLRDWL
ncbi:MAG: hypothetical protein M3Z04_16955 [Chloroflexota bacterium]|nr:hypothetical protein [Chloroflexota bacterium]